MEQKLYFACANNRLEEAKEILTNNPTVNINWKNVNASDRTCLHRACEYGRSSIVPLLLAHPDINVNQKESNWGATPFMWACLNGRTPVVQLMLKDARVLINEPSNSGYTPLSWAAESGYLEVIKWMIASGRDLDLGQTGTNSDAIGKAKQENKTEVVSLLERFKANRTQTTMEIREELGINDFPVATPSKLTREEYVDFLGGKPIPDGVLVDNELEEDESFLTELDSRKSDYPISSVLKCHLCSQPDDPRTVRAPKTLPCLHSFCQICLEQQDRQVNQQSEGTIKCKQCSAVVKIPTDGIQSLECCAFIDSLSKSTQARPQDPNRVQCDLCDSAEVTEHCNKCDENYCAACANSHKRSKATSSHPVVPISEASAERVLHCQKHPTLEVDTYCKTCQEATCPKCAITSHPKHDFCPLSEVAAFSKDEIVTFTVTAAAKEKEAEKCLPTFNTAIKKLEDQRTAAEKELDTTLAAIHAAVDARGEQLKAEMNQKGDEVRNATVKEKSQVETAVVQLREFCVFTEGLLVQGTPLEIAGTHKDVKARNEVLEKMEFPAKPSKEPIIKFLPGNVDQLKQAIATIGSISTSTSN